MRILAVDTSSKVFSLGICDGEKIYEYNLELATRLSAKLAPILKSVVASLGWQMRQIDYFACGLGPGSFTGVRVGLAAIKGLSWALNKPVVGISSLDALAKNYRQDADMVIPVIDAKRKLIYSSAYKLKAGRLKRLAAYMLLTEDEFLSKIKALIRDQAANKIVLTGDGLNLYREKFLKNIKAAQVLEKDCWYPKGISLIELAKAKISRKELSDSFKIRPIYLYPKECQIRKPLTAKT